MFNFFIFKLSLLGVGSFFGEEELIDETPRLSSVYCHSQAGELVMISRREFHRRLFSDDNTRDFLLQHNKIKIHWKETRLNEVKFLQKNKTNLNLSNKNEPPILETSFSMNKSFNDSFNKQKKILTTSSMQLSPSKKLNKIFDKSNDTIKKRTSEKKEHYKNSNSLQKSKDLGKFSSTFFGTSLESIEQSASVFQSKILIKQNSLKDIKLTNKTANDELPFAEEKMRKTKYSSSRNMFKTHISSKTSLVERIKDSFKPQELLKLKAYKKFEEIKDNLNYFQDVKGKKRFEDFSHFEIPNKIKIKLREMQNKMKEPTKSYNNVQIDDSLFTQKKKKKKQKKIEIGKCEEIHKVEQSGKKIKENKKKYTKCMMNFKLLPLKYMANEIQNTQNTFYFPRIQGNKKKRNSFKNKGFTSEILDKMVVEGNNRFFTENL